MYEQSLINIFKPNIILQSWKSLTSYFNGFSHTCTCKYNKDGFDHYIFKGVTIIWSKFSNYDLFQSLMIVFTIANSEDLILYTLSFHLQGSSLFPAFFSCSTQLGMKFQLLIKTKIGTNKEVSCFKSLRCCIYHVHKC